MLRVKIIYRVYGNAQVYGDARVSEYKLINIIGFKFNITISDYHIQLGCEQIKISELKKYVKKETRENYQTECDWWDSVKNIIFGIIKNREKI